MKPNFNNKIKPESDPEAKILLKYGTKCIISVSRKFTESDPEAEILLKYGTNSIIFVSRRCILLYCFHSRNFCCIFYVMIHPNIAFFVHS